MYGSETTSPWTLWSVACDNLDDVQLKDNLTYETSPFLIEHREVKHSRGKEIPLVKVV